MVERATFPPFFFFDKVNFYVFLLFHFKDEQIREVRTMDYQIHTLPGGFRLIYSRAQASVSYCGVVVNAGSRDELENEFGMAHFVEHMLFKGTEKRRSIHIINRLEHVGGDLNAFTSKEETVVYAAVLNEYLERAVELMADIVFHSQFPQAEIDKEVEVILDEIDSYNDTPSELIYDDFENILFSRHALGHLILGDAGRLQSFTTADAQRFVKRQYVPGQMVFFFSGDVPFKKVLRWVEKYFEMPETTVDAPLFRSAPNDYVPQTCVFEKDTHQTHVAIGNRAYDLYHADRMGMYLLNNILGGPGMSSLLNLSLREKRGLVYTVDSTYQPFTDTGEWCVYFGCDPDHADKCEELVYKELKKLRDNRLSEVVLHKYKLQLMGQMAIASENRENMAISLGKSCLRYGYVDDLSEVRRKIDAITAGQLLRIANEVFVPEQLTVLKYK